MKTKLQWQPGPDIRVLDAKLRHGIWIVKADASVEARCPECGISSQRRHSAYVRRLQDLPVQSTAVELRVRVTRWRCDNRLCERKTFVGRPDQVCTSHARETRRVANLARSIGYVAGGRAAERLMHQLGLPQGDDRILRNLKRHAVSSEKPPRVVGIDDWSWLKGSRYGTIVVDLERHKVVDVIGDRSAATMAAWLENYPTIEIVSRDRCGLYTQAVREGASSARQVVADRFHLIQNLRLAIERQLSYNNSAPRVVHSSSTPRDEAFRLQEHRRLVRIGRRNVRLDQFRRVKGLHGLA